MSPWPGILVSQFFARLQHVVPGPAAVINKYNIKFEFLTALVRSNPGFHIF
jgi:hypothetical protein